MTPGTVDVLEGRQCAPSDVLGQPHHLLESPAVAGSDTADRMLSMVHLEKFVRILGAKPLYLLHHGVSVEGPFQVLSDVKFFTL